MESQKSILPQIVLDYVESVIRQMKYRRNIRQDVRAELLAHFEDALRGVDDPQERQKQAEDLIREFGDARLLARLIRRGKKRCRPAWQKAIIRSFQAIGILFLLLIFYIVWFFTGKPVITTNYVAQMNQLVRPVADENQNAWPYYKEAAILYRNPDVNDCDLDSGKLKSLDKPRNLAQFDDSLRHIVEKWLADNSKAMELLLEGNQKPYYWQTYSVGDSKQIIIPSMLDISSINLKECRQLTRLLCWDAYKKAESGNVKEALNLAIAIFDCGRHIRGQNASLIEQLVGIAIEAQACQTITGILSDYEIDSECLASIRHNFEMVIDREKFRIDLAGEKLCFYDELQRCFTQSRFGPSHLYLRRFQELDAYVIDEYIAPGNGFRILFTHPDRGETRQSIDRLFKIYDEMAALSPAVLKKQPQLQEEFEVIIEKNMFMRMIAPAIQRVFELNSRLRMYAQSTAVLLDIHKYKLDTGQFPDSLDELMRKNYLKQIPTDVYSNGSILYKKTNNNFVLYSVGPNFTNDNAQAGRNRKDELDFWAERGGDVVFWPIQKDKMNP